MRSIAKSLALFALACFASDGAFAQTAQQDIAITATVTKACTVNNAAAGTPGSAVIPISVGGTVTTTPIVSNFSNVACNTPSNLQLTSLTGGVLNGTAPGSGFTSIINYTASATWNSVTASVNTATLGTASSAESGAIAPVATANSGNLSVTITPTANALPLTFGSYSDTLRVTLTPQ